MNGTSCRTLILNWTLLRCCLTLISGTASRRLRRQQPLLILTGGADSALACCVAQLVHNWFVFHSFFISVWFDQGLVLL